MTGQIPWNVESSLPCFGAIFKGCLSWLLWGRLLCLVALFCGAALYTGSSFLRLQAESAVPYSSASAPGLSVLDLGLVWLLSVRFCLMDGLLEALRREDSTVSVFVAFWRRLWLLTVGVCVLDFAEPFLWWLCSSDFLVVAQQQAYAWIVGLNCLPGLLCCGCLVWELFRRFRLGRRYLRGTVGMRAAVVRFGFIGSAVTGPLSWHEASAWESPPRQPHSGVPRPCSRHWFWGCVLALFLPSSVDAVPTGGLAAFGLTSLAWAPLVAGAVPDRDVTYESLTGMDPGPSSTVPGVAALVPTMAVDADASSSGALALSIAGDGDPGLGDNVDVGDVSWPSLEEADGHNQVDIPIPEALRLPLPFGVRAEEAAPHWLGVIVHAPHCQSTQWALRLTRGEGPEDLQQAILRLGRALYNGFFDRIAPVLPQRYGDFAEVLVFPQVLLALGEFGHVPVMLDLTHIGGDYFATVLPNGIGLTDLEAFILPHTRADLESFRLFVGLSVQPCAANTPISLAPGDVILGLEGSVAPPPHRVLADMFVPSARWGQLQHIPRVRRVPGLCLYFEGQRYVLRQFLLQGMSVLEAVSEVLGLAAAEVTTHLNSSLRDLDVQGSACAGVVQAVRLPRFRVADATLRQRRDVFVLCDLRPLGVRPLSWHSHSLRVHIPSVLALAQILVPEGFGVLVMGGVREDDEVVVRGNTTLTFHVQALHTDGSVTDADMWSDGDAPDCGSDGSDDGDSSGPDHGPADMAGTANALDSSACRVDGSELAGSGSRAPPSPDTSVAAVAQPCSESHHECGARLAWILEKFGVITCSFGVVSPRAVPAECVSSLPVLLRPSVCARFWARALFGHSPGQGDSCLTWPYESKGPDHLRISYSSDPAQGDPLQEVDRSHVPGWPRFPAHGLPPTLTVLRPPGGPPGDEEDEEALPFDASFMIFTPAHKVDHVVISVQVPFDVEVALEDVHEGRDPLRQDRFPLLLPVDPQPSVEYATLLALPSWADQVPVVLCDCRLYSGAMFATVVSPIMRREDLLSVAGLNRDARVHVYVSYFAWALAPGQRVQLQTGQFFAIVPFGQSHVHGPTLSDMLGSAAGWNDLADVPEILDLGFWVLTDVDALCFPVPVDPTVRLRSGLAAVLDCEPQALTLRSSVPRISDHSDLGRRHCAVLVATCLIPRPVLRPVSRHVVILDLRPLLRGIEWTLLPENRISMRALVDRFQFGCPEGHSVSVKGGHTEDVHGEPYVVVLDGQVLVVEYIADLIEQDDVEFDAAVPDPEGDSEEEMGASSDDEVVSRSRSPRAGPVPGDETGRSARLPFGGLPWRDAADCSLLFLLVQTVACWAAYKLLSMAVLEQSIVSTGCRSMWNCACTLDALAEGQCEDTSVSPRAVSVGGRFRGPFHAVSRLCWGRRQLLLFWLLAPAGEAVVICGEDVSGEIAPMSVYGAHPVVAPNDSRRSSIPDLAGRSAVALPAMYGSVSGHRGSAYSSARPVPTPCREGHFRLPLCGPSRLQSPAPALHDDKGAALCTLLEESVARADSVALLEAVTLLEVLTEHFSGARPVPVVQASSAAGAALSRTTVLLQDLLFETCPVPEEEGRSAEYYDLACGQCELPAPAAAFELLLRPASFAMLGRPPIDVPDPSRFAAWIAAGLTGRSPGPEEEVVLTTDGSYTALGRAAGWAVVVSLRDPKDSSPGQFVGCLYGGFPGEAFRAKVGVSEPNAYLAEVLGLFWAAVCALKFPFARSLVFRADCQSAIDGVAGDSGMPSDSICTAARSLHLGLRAVRGAAAIAYGYVKGHAGDCANELADGLAGLGAQGRECLGPYAVDLSTWLRDAALAARWLPHYCLVQACPSQMPALQGGVVKWSLEEPCSRLPPAQLLEPFLRALRPPSSKVGTGLRSFCWIVASFNVLSIQEQGQVVGSGAGLYGATGRVALLGTALAERQVFLAGLQETRTPSGTCSSACFRRYCSGADPHGQFGVELWVASGPGWPEHEVVVLHACPWRLLVRLGVLGCQYCVLVCHAPHRGHTAEMREAWWRSTTELCLTVGGDRPWLIFADANCRMGSVVSSHVGEHQSDPEDLSGRCFHSLLARLDCWLPCTFEAHMSGHGGTLVQRKSKEIHRGDFVAIPGLWRAFRVAAWVDPAVSAGHAIADHFATFVQCDVRHQVVKLPKVPRIDQAALLDPKNHSRIDSILQRVPRVGWDTNVNDHAAVLSGFLHAELLAAFPLQSRRMRASFLTEETASLHADIARMRHVLRQRLVALSLARLRCAFLVWKGAEDNFDELFEGPWLWQLRRVIDWLIGQIRDAGRILRKLCRRDKRAHLEQLADQVDVASSHDTQVALRRLLRPRKFRRGGPAPLPHLKRADGSVCEDADAVLEEWRRHFAALEGGVEVQGNALALACLERQQALPAREILRCGRIPDVVRLSEVFQAVSPLKAMGPDGIPPSICRRFAGSLALAFWPVVLKVLCYGSEPIGYKGGQLYHIPKHTVAKGATCDSERGILVQSTLQKVLHKALRPLTTARLDQVALPLQLGGRRGLSHMMGYFCSRLYLDYMRQQEASGAILFCDLAAAYYAVIRETLVGRDASSAPLAEVACSLGLSDEDLQALHFYTAEEPVLQQEDAGELLESTARELHMHTWFVLHQDSQIVMTRRGTRPGSSWADSLFSILFARVLQRRGSFAEQGLQPSVPWSGQRDLRPPAPGEQLPRVVVQDIVFADDLATCICAPSAAALPQAVRHVAGCSIDALLNHGLKPNIAPTKTAAILAPAGRGSRAMRVQTFSEQKGKLVVLRETGEAAILDAVAQYRHLGSILTFNGAMLPEVRARVQIGWALFREGRRSVFCSPRISMERRVSLVRSHVFAAMFAGAGAWPALCDRSWRALEAGYFGILRAMLRIPVNADQHWSEERVLATAGMPSLRGLLAVERLRFLSQLWRTGPDEAFALLQNSARAVQAFLDASSWALQAVQSTTSLGPLVAAWGEWTALFAQPGRFKGILKRATAWHVGLLRAAAAFQAFCRASWSALPPPQVELEVASHACLLCGIAFFDEHSWSAHAVRAHGYRSRASRFAVGVRCQACGLRLASVQRHRNHLKTSMRCCQAVEWRWEGLLAPDLSSPGHVQSVPTAGVGTDRLPVVSPVASRALLLKLRCGSFSSDCALFEVVKSEVEPIDVLRNTLRLWLSEVSCDRLQEFGSDVLLCLQPDLLCDTTSRVPRARGQDRRGFEPLLEPFPSPRFWANGFVCAVGSSEAAFSQWALHPVPPVRVFDFAAPCPELGGIAGLSVTIPPAPGGGSCPWEPASCSLRELRRHSAWLTAFFAWLSLALSLVRLGCPCHVAFPCAAESVEPLAGWLRTSRLLSLGVPALSFSFTS